jgi:hypothetical protein
MTMRNARKPDLVCWVGHNPLNFDEPKATLTEAKAYLEGYLRDLYGQGAMCSAGTMLTISDARGDIVWEVRV